MAKHRVDLPSTESSSSSWDNPRTDIKQCIEEANEKVMSTIGYSPVQEEGYISTNMVHMHTPNRADTKITRSQALDLMQKMRKLQDEGATLKDGSPIRNKSDVVRWMIEQPLAPIR